MNALNLAFSCKREVEQAVIEDAGFGSSSCGTPVEVILESRFCWYDEGYGSLID